MPIANDAEILLRRRLGAATHGASHAVVGVGVAASAANDKKLKDDLARFRGREQVTQSLTSSHARIRRTVVCKRTMPELEPD